MASNGITSYRDWTQLFIDVRTHKIGIFLASNTDIHEQPVIFMKCCISSSHSSSPSSNSTSSTTCYFHFPFCLTKLSKAPFDHNKIKNEEAISVHHAVTKANILTDIQKNPSIGLTLLRKYRLQRRQNKHAFSDDKFLFYFATSRC